MNDAVKCIAAFATLLAGCGRLDELEYQPLTTPQQWCERRPCITVGNTVFSEPLGSFLVFLLALLWIGAGPTFGSLTAGRGLFRVDSSRIGGLLGGFMNNAG